MCFTTILPRCKIVKNTVDFPYVGVIRGSIKGETYTRTGWTRIFAITRNT